MKKDYVDEKIVEIFKARKEETIRPHNEKKHRIRCEFDRDRDRILYSKAFRRLSGKTQVFLSGKDDHIRNRMTHTIEVSQIARTIAKALGLSEILTEAIALGHDLGHTPFGHVGERTLNYIMCECDIIRDFEGCLFNRKGFKHNWQGIRVVHELEKSKNNYGLNLTKYTMWGMLHHSKIKNKPCKYKKDNICTLRRAGKDCTDADNSEKLDFYDEYKDIITDEDLTIEALVVALADEIAQRHHDVEDALETKILGFDELYERIDKCYVSIIKYDCSDDMRESFEEIEGTQNDEVKRSKLSSFLVDLLTFDAIINIKNNLNYLIDEYEIKDYIEFEAWKKDENFYEELTKRINLSKVLSRGDKEFQKYISKRILNSHKAQSMDGKGNYIIRELFKAYVTNPQQLPDKTIETLFNSIVKYKCDYLNDSKQKDMLYKLQESCKDIKIDINKVGDMRNKLEELHHTNNIIYKQILMRTICDYIAGMTDRYAMDLYSDLYETSRY